MPKVVAQWAQQPGTEFHSTSTMMGSGSELPMAAIDGVMTAEAPSSTTTDESGFIITGPQRVSPDTPPADPYDNPLGDTPWLFMLLLVAGYAICAWRRTTKTTDSHLATRDSK